MLNQSKEELEKGGERIKMHHSSSDHGIEMDQLMPEQIGKAVSKRKLTRKPSSTSIMIDETGILFTNVLTFLKLAEHITQLFVKMISKHSKTFFVADDPISGEQNTEEEKEEKKCTGKF